MASPSKFSIRTSTVEDLASISTLIEPFVAQRKILPRTRDELAILAQTGFVAVDEEQVVGFAAVEIYSKKLAEVLCLAVREDCHGQGLGRTLVDKCIEFTRERGVLELMAITSSEPLFTSCGFDYSLPDQKRAMFIRP